MKTKYFSTLIALALLAGLHPAAAQGTAFTYQGRLNDGANPAGGNYDLRFAVYDALTGGAQQGVLVTNTATAVSNGLFAVTLDFGNQFPGANRWLEIAVRTNGFGAFTNLAPRQQLTATPYAVQAVNAGTAITAITAGSATLAATATTAGSATSATTAVTANNFSGTLMGDVIGTQGATAVASVGSVSAANVASGANAANLATSANNPSTLVKRDASGNFAAGLITGALAGNAATATTAGTATTANNFSGSLAGEVTGPQGATAVASVGGQSAAAVAGGASAANAATSANAPNTILKRDASGSFNAGGITGTNFTGNGGGLTNLPAGAVVGVLPDARLAPNIARLNGTNFFNGTNTFAGVIYATNANNAINGVFTGSFSGNATTATSATTASNFSGPLAGDVTGTQGATAVASVGGQTAANVAGGASAANAATNANTAGTIVKRNASGNFSAGTITASGFTGDGGGLTNVNGTVPWQAVSGTAQQAQPDTGYVATNNTLVTLTLPAAPAIGDIVRITGTGTNGWKIAQNTNQFVLCANLPGNPTLSGNPFASWTPQATNRNWDAIAMSTDAGTLVGLDYGGHIHVSTDAGQTWVAHANARNWIAVTCSSNGTNMVAADFQGFLYTSTNSGSTWTARATNLWWTALSSRYGSRLYAGESSPGPIYVSFDSGATWSSFASGGGNWTGIANSSDCNDIYAADSIGVLRVSHDGGPTWGNMDASAPTYSWSSIACSSDGTKVVACRDGGYIYTSTNKGTNLTARASSRNWKAVACSSDGSVMVAADGAPGYLYLSTDTGATWTAQSNGPSATWSALACTPDGTKIVAAVKGGQIYISSNATTTGATGYLTGSQYSSIELQYVGSGQFIPISHEGSFTAY